jgi:glutamate-1-semialdehyde 2,1-aminomutase
VLIYDEVVTGFRHALGGYQSICGITPDLTTLGKAVANGFPLSVVCGRADLMDRLNTRPGGDVFFAGTFNGHVAGVTAALATIDVLENEPVYEHLYYLGDRMRNGLKEIVNRIGIAAQPAGFGSVFTLYFMTGPIGNYTDLLNNNADYYVNYRLGLLKRDIYELPMNLKRSQVTYSHTEEDIDRSLQAAEESLREIF